MSKNQIWTAYPCSHKKSLIMAVVDKKTGTLKSCWPCWIKALLHGNGKRKSK